MKKSYNSTDIHQKQGQELSKKLYRSISDQSKRLDDARSCARNIKELFSPSLQIQRRKLCDYCERLMLAEPVLYGRKSEELLWRKAFYDVVAAAKKLKKKEYSPEEVSNLLSHINAGIGFYHHFLSKLQAEFNIDLNTFTDFALVQDSDSKKSEEVPAEVLEFVNHSVHQCLIYLGDLNRYKLDVCPNWEPTLAIRYYLQAISFKPDSGMPHNQMGTLAMNRNQFLEAVYHYMRCLSCSVSFEGTTNNLHSLFEKNSRYLEQLPEEKENSNNDDAIQIQDKSEHIKKFLARFLLLIDIWYFGKKIPKVYSLCHQTFKDLEQCLSYLKPTNSEIGDIPLDSESSDTDSSTTTPTYLTNTMLFKIVVICLLCITKLQASNSNQLSIAVAFTLAIYSQLIQNITNHIQESVLNYPLPEENQRKMKGKRNKSKLRRRNKVVQVDSEESELSENGDDSNDSDSSESSYISDDAEDLLANSSDEEVESKTSNDNSPEKPDEGKNKIQDIDVIRKSPDNDLKNDTKVIEKVKRMDINDMFEIISEEGSLQSIKVLNDWLLNDLEVLKSCGSNTRSLFRQITKLLNLINLNLKSSKIRGIDFNAQRVLQDVSKIPLPEDVTLRGLEILETSQKELDWSYSLLKAINSKEETFVRIAKFLTFGKYLTSVEEVGVCYGNKMFSCSYSHEEEDEQESQLPSLIMEELETENTTIHNNNNKQDPDTKGMSKMKHMGQLWLAAEVRALENRVRGKTSLSPYLVLDVEALIQYTFMVKHLVHSRKFIVLIPSAVLSALDDLKREKQEARDVIRWLEAQFHRGNRFFRAQRPHEKSSIPFIKYPKKKGREMFIYIHIVECCYYLAQQQKDATGLVTLLVGNQGLLTNGESKEFSYVGLAQSAGVTIESITQFYGKWKKTTIKGKR